MQFRLARVAAIALLAYFLANSSYAADFQVDTVNDLSDTSPGDGICATSEILPPGNAACSIRAATEEANALAGDDAIRIPAGLFFLPNGTLSITDPVEILGSGLESTILDGLNTSGVFSFSTMPQGLGTVVVSDLTIRNGVSCIYVADSGAVDLRRIRITGCSVAALFECFYNFASISDSLIDDNLSPAAIQFHDGAGTLAINRTRIERNSGPGMYFRAPEVGRMLLADSIFQENGGAYAISTGEFRLVELTRVSIINNYGGGLSAYQTDFVMKDSRIAGNQGTGLRFIGIDGFSYRHLLNSEISGNISSVDGGGISIDQEDDTSIQLSNMTISGNSAPRGGGMFVKYQYSSGNSTVTNSTISQNVANDGGGVFLESPLAPLTLIDSVVAGNSAANGPDCASDPAGTVSPILSGTNLIGVIDGCGLTGTEPGLLSGDAINPLSPVIGPLRFNGGSTQTHLPLAGSPLIDGLSATATCLPTDGRGVIRPQDGNGDTTFACDIGAVEVGDFDEDGVGDNLDLCPGIADAMQPDLDGDGLGDGCDPFPADPLNQKTVCEVNSDSCVSDLAVCNSDHATCVADLGVAQSDLSTCQSTELLLLQSLEDCQTGPPLIGDVNWDGSVDLLDALLQRRRLADLPIELPTPAVIALSLRKADSDFYFGTVRDGDVYSLSAQPSCLAIEPELNQSGTSLRYDWTPPGGSEQVAYFWENSAPFCWRGDSGWIFFPEVPDCGCSAEMAQIGDHQLVLTPCTVAVDFGTGETCLGNGGVEGPATSISFTITP